MTGPIFNAGAIEATASIDRSQFIRDLRQMQADIAEFQRNPINLSVTIDKEKVKAELRALTQELSTVNNAIKLTMGLDTTQARKDYDAFKASMTNTGAKVNFTGDTGDIKAKAVEATGIIKSVPNTTTTRFTGDSALLDIQIAQAIAKLDLLKAKKVNPEIDPIMTNLDQAAIRVRAKLDELSRMEATPKVLMEIQSAQNNLRTIEDNMRRLSAMTVNPKLDADIAMAEYKLNTLIAKRDDVASKTATVNTNANTAGALAGIQSVEDARRRLDGKTATVTTDVRDRGQSNLIIAGIAAGLAAIAEVAPAAIAGLAGASAVVAVGAQAYGALSLGLNGVAGAYQAMATQAQQGAVQENVSHSGVESALRSLDNTRQSAARSQENAAQSVTQAETSAARTQITGFDSVSNAAESAARTLISNAQAVQSAKDSEARTILTGDRAVSDAEQALTNAQVNATDANKNLNDVRAQEIFTLEDLQLKLKGSALTEQEAALGLQQAVEHLRVLSRDPLATPLQLAQAQEAIQRAQQTVDESKQSYIETQAAADQAAKTGVDGSTAVVAAQKQVTQANQAVQDSVKNLQRAQDDAAYAQQQASAATAKAINDAQYSNEQAAKATAKAIDDANYANSQSALAVTKSLEAQTDARTQGDQSILDALARVQDAQDTAANLGVKAFNRVQYAMSLLSPEGQAFALFLYNDMRPAINSIDDAVAHNMLPQFQSDLQRLLDLLPETKTGLGETGLVIGQLATEGTNLATSPGFKAEFATILHGNNLMMGDLGRSGILVGQAFTSMYTASLPLIESFTLFVNKGAVMFDQWVQGKVTSGQFATFMQLAGEKAKELWGFLVQLVTTTLDLGVALAPVGATLLSIVDAGLKIIDWISKANPAILQFIAYSTALYFALTNVGKGALALSKIFETGQSRYDKIGAALQNASLQAGVYTEKIVGTVASSETAATAGEKVATAGSKVSNAISKLGTALPIAGVALIALTAIWDSAITSLNDGATAMLKGGSAADQMTTKVDDQLTGFGKWLNSMLHFVPTSQDMRVEMQKQLDAMDPLQRAQTLATQAQNDYSNAVNKFGTNSPAAIAASNLWKDATQRASDVQDNLRQNLVSATDALIAQRDEMLGNLNAEIRFKDDLAQLTQGVKDHGASVNLDTDAGRRNVEQLNNMSQAAIDNLTQMVKNGDTTQQVTDKTNYYKDSLYNAAIQIGYTKEQARQYVDQLHLVPSNEVTNIQLNGIDGAAQALQHYIDSLNVVKNMGPLQTVLDLRQQVLQDIVQFPPPRAKGGIDFVGMAAGGIVDIRSKAMSANLAAIVAPNTPTLIGDNKKFNEAYIPLDPSSKRSQDIFDLTAKALGRTGAAQNETNSNFKTSLADQKAFNSTVGANAAVSSNGNTSNNVNSVSNTSSSNIPIATQQNKQTTDSGTTIGTVVVQVPYGASPQEYVEHLDFALQYHRKKGVYKR